MIGKSLFRWPVLINAVLFQITWFACVLGSAKGLLWPALLSCLALAVFQLQPSRRHPTDFKLIATCLILGIIVDTSLVQAGFVDFTDERPFAWLAPAWILTLWVAFGLTINHSLSWLNAHPLLPAVLGLIGGPLSYFAGLRLGAVDFTVSQIYLIAAVGIGWAISLTILVRMSGDDKAADSN